MFDLSSFPSQDWDRWQTESTSKGRFVSIHIHLYFDFAGLRNNSFHVKTDKVQQDHCPVLSTKKIFADLDRGSWICAGIGALVQGSQPAHLQVGRKPMLRGPRLPWCPLRSWPVGSPSEKANKDGGRQRTVCHIRTRSQNKQWVNKILFESILYEHFIRILILQKSCWNECTCV